MRSQYSRYAAIALIAVVTLAGCTALPALPLPTVTPRAPAVGESPILPEMPPTAAPEPPAPVPTLAPEPTGVPTAVVPSGPATLLDGCVADADQLVATRGEDGYCLAYPARFKAIRDVPEQLSIVGPALDESVEPVMATLNVTVAPSPGGLEDSVATFLEEFAGFSDWKINRMDVGLGGVPAVMFEPVPGRLSGRVLLAVFDGKLYRLDFWPVDLESALPDVNELYNAVISTWQFIPAAPAIGISGRVIWGEATMAGSPVELRTPDWRTNPNSIVATTIADSQGFYEFKAPMSGRYEVVPAFEGEPAGAPPQAGIPVTVAPGGKVEDLNVFLAKTVKLLEPGADAQVGTAPVLSWEPVEGAASYRVIVNDPVTGEGYFGVDVSETSVKIDPPLEPGKRYAWVVNALTADQGLLGVGEEMFTVQ